MVFSPDFSHQQYHVRISSLDDLTPKFKKSKGLEVILGIANITSINLNNYQVINWVLPKIMVPPNHPFLIGFSIINHPFWGKSLLFLETPNWPLPIISLFNTFRNIFLFFVFASLSPRWIVKVDGQTTQFPYLEGHPRTCK